MKRGITFLLFFVLFAFCNQSEAQVSSSPETFEVNLEHGDSVLLPITITNNGDSDISFDVEGVTLLAEKEFQVLALVNGADTDDEYPNTIEAINEHFTNYALTELTTFDAGELEAALETIDLLWIPEQEECDEAAFSSFAPVLSAFVNAGGTVVFNGNSAATSPCIFNTGLFSGSHLNFVSDELNIIIPDDPYMDGISEPYEALAVTNYYDINNTDAIRVIEYNNFDVFCYRNIGAGRAILVGHDYRFSNFNMDKLMANTFEVAAAEQAANGTIDWLFVSENIGEIPAGGSITLDLEFNATDVFGGTFNQEITIVGSDGTTVTVPCVLNVTGVPDFAINVGEHDFGQVLQNDSAFFTFVISNPGTDSLFVNNILFDDTHFTASPSSFALYGGGTEQEVVVAFVPTEIENYSALMTLETNLISYFAIVSGVGVGSPVTTITPPAINVTIDAGASTTESLTVANTGLGPLFYDIDTVGFDAEANVLVYTLDVDEFELLPSVYEAIELFYPDAYELTETQTPDPSELEDLLNGTDIFLVPGSFSFNTIEFFFGFQEVLQTFVEEGGSVIFLGNSSFGDHPMYASGLFSGFSSFSFGSLLEVLDEDNPLATDLPLTFFPSSVTPQVIDNTDIVRVVQQPETYYGFGDGDILAYRTVGDGNAIYVGSDFFGYFEEDAVMLRNAMVFAMGGAVVDWLSVEGFTGEVQFPAEEIIDITLDATDLLGGTYTASLIFNTNDPLAPTITVPITMVVVGTPAIEVSTTNLDFGNVIIGNTSTASITIDNPGTDSLFVDILSDFPEIAGNITEATVEPGGGSIEIIFTFTPDEIESLSGAITLVTNAGDIVINVNAVGQGAPVIEVNPSEIDVTLLAGESTTETVTISNTGAGVLDFNSPSSGSSGVQILALTYGINTFGYENLLNALDGTGLSFTLEEYSNTDPAGLADALAGKTIILMPQSNFFGIDFEVFTNYGPVIQEFVNNGGTIIFTGNDCSQCINNIGLLQGNFFFSTFGDASTVLLPEHPLATDLADGYSSFNNFIYEFETGTAVIEVFLGPGFGGSIAQFEEFGNGKAIYIAPTFSYEYTTSLEEDATLLANAINWGGGAPNWLNISDLEGSIDVGESFTFDITFDATGLLAGDYTFNVPILTNDPLNPVVFVAVTMTVLAFPQAGFTADAQLSCDGEVSFADLTLNNPTSWTWDFGDGSTAGIQNPTHVYGEDGVYTVSLEACNDLGCDTFTIEDYITVDFASTFCDTIQIPIFDVLEVDGCNGVLLDTGGDGPYQPGTNGTVSIVVPEAAQIVLEFSEFNYQDFGIPGSGDFITIYDGPNTSSPIIGTYSGSLLPNGGIVSSSGGAITIQEQAQFGGFGEGFVLNWSCITPDTPPVPTFSFTVVDACTGLIEFTDETGNFPNEWSWNFGDGSGNFSLEQDPTYSFPQSGTYPVSMTACNIAGCESITLDVSIEGVMFVDVNIPQYIQLSTPVMFMDNTENAVSWEWDFGNGNEAIGIANPVTFYQELGIYTVEVTVVNSEGCVRTYTQNVEVVEDVGIYNNDNSSLVKVYPNPAQSLINVNYTSTSGALSSNAQIQLMNALGQNVLVEEHTITNQWNHSINVSHLARGMYWLVVITETGSMAKQAIVLK